MTLAPGQRVRTKLITTSGHTRLPSYARGRVGEVHAVRGTYPISDELVRAGVRSPQVLYNVRFDARDLWGDDAERHHVHLDLYESYLEPEGGTDGQS